VVYRLAATLAAHGMVRRDSAGRLRLGAGARAVELTERQRWRPEVSSTFHGRDIFAPVAAQLTLGCPLEDFGSAVIELLDLPWPEPRQSEDGTIQAEVISVDVYGNLITNLRAEDLPSRPLIEIGRYAVSGLSTHFQSGASLIALVGSTGFLELAAPNSSASQLLNATSGTPLVVTT